LGIGVRFGASHATTKFDFFADGGMLEATAGGLGA
jgi:hypothetical protein